VSCFLTHVSHLNCYISGLPGQQGPAGFTGATGAKGAKGRRRRRQAGCPGKRNAIVPVAEGRITDCRVLSNKVENGDRRQFVGMPLYYSFVVGSRPHLKYSPSGPKSPQPE